MNSSDSDKDEVESEDEALLDVERDEDRNEVSELPRDLGLIQKINVVFIILDRFEESIKETFPFAIKKTLIRYFIRIRYSSNPMNSD